MSAVSVCSNNRAKRFRSQLTPVEPFSRTLKLELVRLGLRPHASTDSCVSMASPSTSPWSSSSSFASCFTSSSASDSAPLSRSSPSRSHSQSSRRDISRPMAKRVQFVVQPADTRPQSQAVSVLLAGSTPIHQRWSASGRSIAALKTDERDSPPTPPEQNTRSRRRELKYSIYTRDHVELLGQSCRLKLHRRAKLTLRC